MRKLLFFACELLLPLVMHGKYVLQLKRKIIKIDIPKGLEHYYLEKQISICNTSRSINFEFLLGYLDCFV